MRVNTFSPKMYYIYQKVQLHIHTANAWVFYHIFYLTGQMKLGTYMKVMSIWSIRDIGDCSYILVEIATQ